jgi:putative N6-adenine-specific DNA methylase
MSLPEKSLFFVIIPPGLESIGKEELESKFKMHFKNSTLEIKNELIGGLLIECHLLEGLLLNKILKIPSRILLRVDTFKVKDGPKLFNKISKIKWGQFILGNKFELSVSSKNSRLFDDRKIESAVQKGIEDFINRNPFKKKYLELNAKLTHPQKIFVRLENDECTVSIDTTGELLHFRGRKTLTALAPIRENLACALLYLTINNWQKDDLLLNKTIIDPMCGSGTFLIEAFELTNVENDRSFAFESAPYYLENKNQLKLESESSPIFSTFYGFDINPEVLEMAQTNKQNKNIHFINADVFDKKSTDLHFQKSIVIINPPYGIRVKTSEEINSQYFSKLIEQIDLKFNPQRIGIIIPSVYQFNFKKEYQLLSKTKLKNGGIPIIFYVLERTN